MLWVAVRANDYIAASRSVCVRVPSECERRDFPRDGVPLGSAPLPQVDHATVRELRRRDLPRDVFLCADENVPPVVKQDLDVLHKNTVVIEQTKMNTISPTFSVIKKSCTRTQHSAAASLSASLSHERTQFNRWE